MGACYLYNRIFINNLVSFYNENKITEDLIKSSNTCESLDSKHYIQNNTECTERGKTSFPK